MTAAVLLVAQLDSHETNKRGFVGYGVSLTRILYAGELLSLSEAVYYRYPGIVP